MLLLEADGQGVQGRQQCLFVPQEEFVPLKLPRQGLAALVEMQFGIFHWSFRVEDSSSCIGYSSCHDTEATT